MTKIHALSIKIAMLTMILAPTIVKQKPTVTLTNVLTQSNPKDSILKVY